jgi:hypothetical protein
LTPGFVGMRDKANQTLGISKNANYFSTPSKARTSVAEPKSSESRRLGSSGNERKSMNLTTISDFGDEGHNYTKYINRKLSISNFKETGDIAKIEHSEGKTQNEESKNQSGKPFSRFEVIWEQTDVSRIDKEAKIEEDYELESSKNEILFSLELRKPEKNKDKFEKSKIATPKPNRKITPQVSPQITLDSRKTSKCKIIADNGGNSLNQSKLTKPNIAAKVQSHKTNDSSLYFTRYASQEA